MPKKLDNLMNEVLSDKSIEDNSEKLFWLEKVLREEQSQCQSRSMKSLSLFIILSVAWLLVKSNNIQSINIGNFELKDPQIILLVLPLIMGYSFYRFSINSCWNDLYNVSLGAVIEKIINPMCEREISSLIKPKDHFFNEAMMAAMPLEGRASDLSMIGQFVTVLSLFLSFLVPLAFLSWVSLQLLFSQIYNYYLSIGVAAIVIIYSILSITYVVVLAKLNF